MKINILTVLFIFVATMLYFIVKYYRILPALTNVWGQSLDLRLGTSFRGDSHPSRQAGAAPHVRSWESLLWGF